MAKIATDSQSLSRTGVKSAVRVMEVLEFFRRHNKPARAVEISEMLDMPPSSTDGLLKSLVDLAYLTFDACTKQYAISMRTTRLCGALASSQLYNGRVNDALQELTDQTNETSALLIRNGRYMQFVAVMRGRVFCPQAHSEGTKCGLIETAAGRAWLSTKSNSEVIEIASQASLERHAPMACSSYSPLIKTINEVRCSRFAFAELPTIPGYYAVAAPLPCSAARIPMVMGVACPSPDLRDRFRRVLHTCMESIH